MNIKQITLIQKCPTPSVRIGGRVCVSVTVYPGGASLTFEQFKDWMTQYNLWLSTQTRYADEEAAGQDGIVSGQEFLWADDTDVGIKGDKHIMT